MEEFTYYQVNTCEQFTFYRIPKLLFTDQRFKNLSSEAKILYGIMLDRMGLSRQNGWVDEHGNVFIRYSVNQMMQTLGWTRYRIYVLLDELDSRKGIGLIERQRVGNNRSNIIYVKNFTSGKNRIRGEPDVRQSDIRTSEQSDNRMSDRQITGCLSAGYPDVCPSDTNDINLNKNDFSENIFQGEKERKKLGTFGNVFLTSAELQQLQEKYPCDWNKRIDNLSKYLESTGKIYRNHFATICLWADREKSKEIRRHYDLPEGKGL